MMELDTTTVIKCLSIFIAGVLGIWGTVFSSKREDGNFTGGRFVIVLLILASMLFSEIVTVLEANNQKVEARQQLERMENLYHEIQRTIQPINYVKLIFYSALPMEDKDVKKYATYLDTIIDSRKSKLQYIFPGTLGFSVLSRDLNGDILTVEIDQKSPYWPKKDSAFDTVARTLSFRIVIRKDPIKPELINTVIGEDFGNDLYVWFTKKFLSTDNVLSLDYRNRKLSIHGSDEYVKELWHATGRIASVQDLLGAQLFLLPPNTNELTHAKEHILNFPPGIKMVDNRPVFDLIRSLSLKTVALELAPGRLFWISGNKFAKTRLSDGSFVFSIVLPKTEKELFFGLGDE